jgi:hypothetical protein
LKAVTIDTVSAHKINLPSLILLSSKKEVILASKPFGDVSFNKKS